MGKGADNLLGTLDLLVLRTLSAGEHLHGYSIAERIHQRSEDVLRVEEGSLYPALHRLENRGLLAAGWDESETGREAKFYRLTRKGRAALGSETENWQRLAGAIGAILKLTEGGAE